MKSDLELSIYRTTAYFAHFHYPLTSFEIWKWLLEPSKSYTFAQVFAALDGSDWLKEKLAFSEGFYGLGDVKMQVSSRQERLLNAFQKYAKLKWVLAIVGRMPYIDGIAVCNSLAFHHTLPKSDIDLFIVARPGRIWSARFFATAPLMLLRQRPGERAEDPVCLSFFVTPQTFDFGKLKIGEKDPYLAYWCRTLIPLLDRSGWTRQFLAENSWGEGILPHAQPVKRARLFRARPRMKLPGTPLSETLAAKIQEEKFPPLIREMKNKDTRVIISAGMLKFHDRDRRAEIRDALDERMRAVV